jgi:ABC-type transporter Mla subunit MlaD
VVLEPDAFPEIRIVAPEGEVEVAPDANVAIAWSAEDDFGLSEAALVLKLPSGDEDRRPLSTLEGARRDAGSYVLQLGPARLAEGERILYWLEVKDTDTVSGPKLAASNTQVVKIYSEAEHRRVALEKAKRAFEEMIVLLADRLETFAAGPVTTPDRLVLAENLDARTRQLVQLLRDTAAELRRDKAGPREVAAALQNLSGTLRIAEQRLASIRQTVARFVRARVAADGGLARQMAAQDGRLDEELEKGILYLEQLLDKRRAEDLVRLAKEMARSRRELAGLLEKYRDAPTDAARQAVKEQIARMRERMKDLMARMSELAKGFNDEHMNREALAEVQKSKDMMSALDQVEELLAKGDVEGAMKALDELGGQMDQMVSALQKTAGMPDEKAQALMKEMLAFKKELEEVQARQQQVAGETEKVRAEYRRKIQQRMKEAEKTAQRLERLAAEARKDVERAQPGVSMRAEPDFEAAREGLRDLERALAMRDLDAAMGTVQKTLPSVERLAVGLEEDAEMAERGSAFRPGDPRDIREAMEEARQAVPKTREIKEELSRLMPDPREVLGERQQRRLSELSQEQSGLEQRAGQLQQQLQQLAEKAPVFPPQAQGQLGESRGHMGQAAMELGQRNPQRGHGEQQAALDALERFRKGLEDAAKQGQGQGQGGQGFPFPFADSGQSSGQEQMGDGQDPSREKVKIPGAEAHKVPEEFRKDLLEAMKQGAPERYKGEVQRYYEELVK